MDFYRRVELVCHAIPYGKVATYGQIALLCQKPKNSRQVGYALNHKITDDVPAHRVINSRGFLSGAASFSQPGQQKLMLRAEGVEVDKDNMVDLKKYGWHNTLEDALELEALFEKEGI